MNMDIHTGEDRDLKIVFVGPPGAGKSTAIKAISDLPPVSTDVPASCVAGSATSERLNVHSSFGSSMPRSASPAWW